MWGKFASIILRNRLYILAIITLLTVFFGYFAFTSLKVDNRVGNTLPKDSQVQKDFEKWKKFVAEKQLGGVQLFADKDWNSDFIKSFGINSIPRFILIDPSGKVVSADAARPSDSKLSEQLDALLK